MLDSNDMPLVINIRPSTVGALYGLYFTSTSAVDLRDGRRRQGGIPKFQGVAFSDANGHPFDFLPHRIYSRN